MVRKSEIASDKFLPNRSVKPNFELVNLDAKAVAARIHGVSDDTIDAGLIVPSPPFRPTTSTRSASRTR